MGVMEKVGGDGIALEILEELPAAARVPRRIRERLLPDYTKTPPSAQDIEAKLRHAHLRRQQFYDDVSRKARPKGRSRSYSPSPGEELGQRIEARLLAAEQKRSNILAKAQMRLARLDELRQAAKTGVQMRFERERMKLGRRVESRVQKAEANRMRILKASHQKRACVRERTSQSILRRIARESKYKERVRASIHQKRVAAEKKRLGLLEAEKKKAHARVLQVRHVAQSVSHRREIERSRMRDRLEDKLQRAKRQRAEFLRQRRRQRDSVSLNWNTMHDAADLLSRKLARCWRCFVRWKRTTSDLAKAYDRLKIDESLPFEQLAILIESPVTLDTVKSLLDRLEIRMKISTSVGNTYRTFVLDNIDHLLKRVATPRRRITPTPSSKCREGREVFSSSNVARTSAKSSRYPVRVVLSAYMILGHPDAVLSGHGEQEVALHKAAEGFMRELRLLIKVIQEGPVQCSDREPNRLLPRFRSFRSQLGMFDKAWCAYLNSFVVWKVKDAWLLEEDLVRAACQLELSMIQKCKLTPEGDDTMLTHDMKAIQKQVIEDQKLLREKVQHLSGDAGIERMECALSETRSKYFQAKENGSPISSPLACFFSPSPAMSPVHSMATSSSRSKAGEGVEEPRGIVRSLFREDNISSSRGFGSSRRRNYSLDELRKENEFVVNEFLHEWNCMFSDGSSVGDEVNDVKTKIRQTMERAFWDSVMESMQVEEPDYGCILQLMREVRDELCQMVPQSWKAEISESIDLELLSQLLKSGGLDVDFLGKMLEFSLVTLRKLSTPANDDEIKNTHQKLLEELSRLCQARDESKNLQAVAIVRGIRFILEQIQALKREISVARIRILEPLLKGPAGFDYLRQAFEKHYGSPSRAHNSLPLTRRWMSSLMTYKDEWEVHRNILSALTVLGRSSTGIPASASLKTGGALLFPGTAISPTAVKNTAGGELSECKGERVDLSIRLGLLKLVSQVSGLTQEVLPETFLLNLSRLRAIQAQIQKIIVVSTSTLVWRQVLVSEKKFRTNEEMESMMRKCLEKLFELLDGKEEAGVREIVETMSGVGAEEEQEMGEKVEARKRMMRGVVRKSLEEGDAVYEKVARCIYSAARGVVLGGNGDLGKELADKELRKVGGGEMLKGRLIETARLVGVAACVSVRVHGPWYTHLMRHVHHHHK